MNGQIPWKESPLGGSAPEGYEKVPLYEVIKRYSLEVGEEMVVVNRVFCNCEESLRVNCDGPDICESVFIKDGKIENVYNTVPPERIEDSGLDAAMKDGDSERVCEVFERIFKQKVPPEKTYHNLKRFEFRMRELPWQEDLEAIYRGSDVFEEGE